MTLFENRIFEDVIKVRIFWDEIILGLGWTPNLMTGILKKEGTGRFETHRTQRIKQCEADTGVDDHWQPPAAGREGRGQILRVSRRNQSCPHLDFRLLAY